MKQSQEKLEQFQRELAAAEPVEAAEPATRKKATKRSTAKKQRRTAPAGKATRQPTTVYEFWREGEMHRKTVYFRPEEWAAIERLAEEERTSCTQIVRRAVRNEVGL